MAIKQTQLILLSLFLSGVASAETATSSTWIARLTGRLSCEGRTVEKSTLGEALDNLEANEVVVQEGKVGRLEDQMFCSGCNCPEGSYNIAKVRQSQAVEDLVKKGDWEKIDPTKILPIEETVEESSEPRILPVIPQI